MNSIDQNIPVIYLHLEDTMKSTAAVKIVLYLQMYEGVSQYTGGRIIISIKVELFYFLYPRYLMFSSRIRGLLYSSITSSE